jgi:hypothetical protein
MVKVKWNDGKKHEEVGSKYVKNGVLYWDRQKRRKTGRTQRKGRSQFPRGLRPGSAAALLLELWVRIPPVAWMFVSCVCVVCCQVQVIATDRSLFQRRPVECGMSKCDSEASIMRRPWPHKGLLCHGGEKIEGRCKKVTRRMGRSKKKEQ